MQVKIEKLITGGLGLAHDSGKTLFVKDALPGEEVVCSLIQEKKNYSLYKCEKVLSESADRITPQCNYYGKCGGCDFAILDAKASAYAKEEIVKDNIARLGHVNYPYTVLPPLYSSLSGYRNRVRFHVDLKKEEIGFLANKDSKLIPLSNCPCLTERLNALLKTKVEILQEARKIKHEKGLNRYGYVEVPLLDGNEQVSFGNDSVKVLNYSVDSSCFFQSNIKVLPSMLDAVKNEVYGNTIMDLYSGVGTFSALFPEKKVFAVEKFKGCLKYAKENAPNAISVTDDVFLWAKKQRKEKIDTIIVDPPRVGLQKEVPSLLLSFSPKRIIYVSCDSVTLSRDIPLFFPYKVQKLQVFDLYPGSHHEESAVVLSRID